MNRDGNSFQDSARKRRVERYVGEFLGEPSMSAPQPIPEKGRRANKSQAAYDPKAQGPVGVPGDGPSPATQQYAPVQPFPAQPEWPQGYPLQSYPRQNYPQQPYAPQGYPQSPEWPQGYPPQGYPQQSGWQGATQPADDWRQVSVPPAGEMASGWQPSQPQQTSSMQPWQGTNGYVPPQRPTPAGMPQPPRDGRGRRKPSLWWKLLLLVVAVTGVVVATIAIPASVAQNKLNAEVAAYDDCFCEGVYVDGIHLGGMTRDEAYNVVSQQAQARMESWEIRLEMRGSPVGYIHAQDLGMQVDVNEALDAAWEPGHGEGTAEERKAEMDSLLQEPFEAYTASPSGDVSQVDAILDRLASAAYLAPKDAYVSEYDPQAHSNPFTIEDEVQGRWLDVKPAKEQIYAMVERMESGTIALEVEPLAPSVTAADLRRLRTLRGSATTDISTTSTTERTDNIKRAFELINGTVIKPGESFSFNGIVGARTAKNGFYQAIEYAYGEERYGYGGGVCQASTTVYLAAVRANMTITKREPHSDKVNYTEYGLDATVNYDGKKIDLTFKNTTNSDIYIISYLVRSGGRWVCHVDIYGEALAEGVTYDLVAETVEILSAPVDPEYVEDKNGEHVTYIDETPVQKRKASDGCIVETFIVQYQNGVEVNRTFMARDTYKAKAQQLWVGVNDPVNLGIP